MLYCLSSARICSLKRLSSLVVNESALAITGTRLTFWCSFFMAATSSILNLGPKADRKAIRTTRSSVLISIIKETIVHCAFCSTTEKNKTGGSPVAVRRDEVEATVNAVVHDGLAVQAALVLKVFLELGVYVVGQSLASLLRI